MLRPVVALVTGIAAFLGLLNWQSAALTIACIALVLALVANLRIGRRDEAWDQWTAGQLVRARNQAAALEEAKEQASAPTDPRGG